MDGFLALHLAAAEPHLAGVASISGWNIAPPAGIAFAQALLAASDPRVTEQHMATDHSFSNHRTRA